MPKEAQTGIPEQQTKSSLYIDLGSSTLKVVIPIDGSPSSQTHYYHSQVLRDNDYPGINFGTHNAAKVIWGDELQKIATFIASKTPKDLTVLNITSAKKPLYAWRKTPQGGLRQVLFYDEPTLTTELTSEEDDLIQKTLCLTDSIDHNNPLLKILALKKNPALIQFFFGESATFEDLHFGTLATFIRQAVTGEERPKVGKNYTLAFGMNGCSESDVKSLILELGITQQLDFETQSTITIGETSITEVDDFCVEVGSIIACANEGRIKNRAVIIGADSVGKVMTPANNIPEGDWGKLDQYERVRYKTQRTLGQANNWLKPLVKQIASEGEIPEGIVDRILIQEMPTHEWFFDPLANNQDGGLYHWENDGYIEINRDELATTAHLRDINKIVTAVTWGAAAGLVNLLPDNFDYDTIYIYGGLIGEYDYGPNLGWCNVLRAVMPTDKRVELFGIDNAAIAMWLVYTLEHGGYINLNDIVHVTPISGNVLETNGLGLKPPKKV